MSAAKAAGRKPWFKFHTADWRGDAGLRKCSFAARGLWADLLSLMHEAEPYGHLVDAEGPLEAKDLARMIGGKPREIAKLIAELEEKRVLSRTESGVIFSRRMVRDHQASEEGRDYISRRWGKQKGEPPNRGADREADREANTKKPEINSPLTPPPELPRPSTPPPTPSGPPGDLLGMLNPSAPKSLVPERPPPLRVHTGKPKKAVASAVGDGAKSQRDRWPKPKVRTDPIPEKIGGLLFAGCLEECLEVLDVGRDFWLNFRHMLSDMLAEGADMDRDILPVMREAKRKGVDNISSAKWFAYCIRERRLAAQGAKVAAA